MGIRRAIQAFEDAVCRRFAPAVDDRRWLVRRFHDFSGYWPNLRDPKTYREKLLWLNLCHRDPLIPVLSDKWSARGEVARRVGPEVLIDLLGVWDDPEQIPFDELPPQFVLKTTAGSAQNVFCWNPAEFDRSAAKAKLRRWLEEDYSRRYREWCYQSLKPRIIAEPLMVDPAHPARSPDDLKIHCFNGRPKVIKFCTDRRGDRRYECLDPQWNVLELGLVSPSKKCLTPPPKPDGLDHLLEVATRLSAGFPYVRVDLYRHQGRTAFGEMTWFPHAGNVPIAEPRFDRLLGDWIQLPAPGRRPAAWRAKTRLKSPLLTAPASQNVMSV